jgi:acyl-phosphate glycerol 3-phosphate acyltransferase
MRIFIAILISYLIGSIPSGFLLTKYVMKKDVRQYGSGNIGATNVARVMGLKSGILVAVFDILKGYLGVMVGQAILGDNLSTAILFVAIAAIAGHDWSIFLGFSGGERCCNNFWCYFKTLSFSIFNLRFNLAGTCFNNSLCFFRINYWLNVITFNTLFYFICYQTCNFCGFIVAFCNVHSQS